MGFKNPTDSLRVLVTGVNLTAGVATSSAALPVNSAGATAKYVRVAMPAGTAAHVRLGASGVTAAATDTLIAGGYPGTVFDASGCTHIACIQEGTGGQVNVVPLEW